MAAENGDGAENGEGAGAPNNPEGAVDPVAPNRLAEEDDPNVGMPLPPPKGDAAPPNGVGAGAGPPNGVVESVELFEAATGLGLAEKGDGEGAPSNR